MLLNWLNGTRATLRLSLVCATAIVGVASLAHADELSDLKAQADALAQQNQALQQRINQIGMQQGRSGYTDTAPAPQSGQGFLGNFFGGGSATPGSPGGSTGTGGAPTVQESRTATAAPSTQTIGGTPPIPSANALTYLGITLYGTVDIGASYQTHATPFNGQYSQSLEYLISRNSNRSQVSVAPNALSFSNIGLQGREPLFPGLNAVFNVQAQFNPASGNIDNSVESLVQNNGIALNRQTTNGDSSRAGQAFQIAYGGLSSAKFGTITIGRQSTLTNDSIVAYDPLFAASAFSVFGYSGVYGGAGDTEDTRLDSSLKYLVNYGPVHGGAFYQFDGGNHTTANGSGSGAGRNSYQFDIGTEYKGFNFDAVYSKVYDAVAAAPLSAAQVPTVAPGTLAATISDNKTLLLDAKYKIGKAQLFVGYENIYYQNPRDPLANGSQGLNNFVLSIVNNTAYTKNRQLQVYWGGVRYGITKKVSIDAGYYRVHQNSYAPVFCSNTSLGTCRGDLTGYSLLATWLIAPRFTAYAGAMLSTVSNGFASGYINNTTIDPTIGGRFAF